MKRRIEKTSAKNKKKSSLVKRKTKKRRKKRKNSLEDGTESLSRGKEVKTKNNVRVNREQ